MKKLVSGFFFFLAILFLGAFGCSDGGGDRSDPLGSSVTPGGGLTFSVRYRAPVSSPLGRDTLKAAVDPSAYGVSRIRATVTTETAQVLTQDFPYFPGGSGQVPEVPVGVATVLVQALSGSDQVLFSGSTQVTVIENSVSSVDSLSLFSEAVQDLPLTLSEVAVSGILSNGATIQFSTNHATMAEVRYGLAEGTLSQTVQSSDSPVTTHAIFLSGLLPETEYFYQVTVKDSLGKTVQSGNLSFKTVAVTTSSSGFAVSINTGATHSKSEAVVLTLTGTSLATSVKIAEGTDASAATVQSFSGTVNFTLSTSDGLKTVTVQYLDATGKVLAAVSASITLDKTPPQLLTQSSSSVTATSAILSGTSDEKVYWTLKIGKTTAYELFTGTWLTTLLADLAASVNTSQFATLESNTTYHYAGILRDLAGNETVTGDYTFTTLSGTPALSNAYVLEFGKALVNPDDGSLVNAMPRVISVYPANNWMLVGTEYNTNKIQVFDYSGNFITSFAPGLSNITGMAAMGNKCAVAANGQLVEMTLSPVGSVTSTLSRGLMSPGIRDVRISPDLNYLTLVQGPAGSDRYVVKLAQGTLNHMATFSLSLSAFLNNFTFDPSGEIAWASGRAEGESAMHFAPLANSWAGRVTIASMTASAPGQGQLKTDGWGMWLYGLRYYGGTPPKIAVCNPDVGNIKLYEKNPGSPPGTFTSRIGVYGTGTATGVGIPVNLYHPTSFEVEPINGNFHVADYNRIAVTNPTNGDAIKYYGDASPSFHFNAVDDLEAHSPGNFYLVRPNDGPSGNGLVSVYNGTPAGFVMNLKFSPAALKPIRIEHVPGSQTFFMIEAAVIGPYLSRWEQTTASTTTVRKEQFNLSGNTWNGLVYVWTTNDVWAISTDTNRLVRFKGFDLSYSGVKYGLANPLATSSTLLNPGGLVTNGNYVFVTDNGNNRIQVWSATTGTFVKHLSGLAFKPYRIGIAYTTGRLYLTDSPSSHVVRVLDSTTGGVLATVGSCGTGQSQFYYPRAIDCNADTYYWVADQNCRIQMFQQ